MNSFKRWRGVAGALCLVAGAALAPVQAVAQQKGGVLSVAMVGEPPTLDPMVSTADVVGTVTQHIFETLYTFDAKWGITPLLAADLPVISDGGKVYAIRLREGVKFHDGSAMSVKDVVASLERWTRVAIRGKQTAQHIAKIEAADAHTVRITLKAPYAPLPALLSLNNSAAVIMPASKQDNPLSAPIGTGPYLLKERKADQYIQLTRFDGYRSRPGEPNGYGGARKQYLDEIRFVPVPDPSTRVEAAISGQFGYVDTLPVEAHARLKGLKTSEPEILKPYGYNGFTLNLRQGLLTNQDVRLAVRTALSMEDMLAAAFGDPAFYALDASLYPKSYAWNTTAGAEGRYNQANVEAAKALLKKAGYKSQPLRILTSRQFEFDYKAAQVAAEYLKQAGFKVDLQVLDWATLTQRRTNPALWEMYVSHSPFLPEPALIGQLAEASPGGWNSPARKAAMDAFTAEPDSKKRVALWAQVQKLVYDEVPYIKIGDFNALAAKSRKLAGTVPAPWPYFWNAYLKP